MQRKKRRIRKKDSRRFQKRFYLSMIIVALFVAYTISWGVNNQREIKSRVWTFIAQGEYPGSKLTETKEGLVRFEVPFKKRKNGKLLEAGRIIGVTDGFTARAETKTSFGDNSRITRDLSFGKDGVRIDLR